MFLYLEQYYTAKTEKNHQEGDCRRKQKFYILVPLIALSPYFLNEEPHIFILYRALPVR